GPRRPGPGPRAVADLERLGRPGARDTDRAHVGRDLARAAPGRQTPGVAAAFRITERRMGKITDVAERFWSGDLSPADRHPWAALHELEELEAGIAFVSTFANVTAFETGAGLVLVDTGAGPFAGQLHAAIRRWSRRPLHTAIFS